MSNYEEMEESLALQEVELEKELTDEEKLRRSFKRILFKTDLILEKLKEKEQRDKQ